MSTVQDETQARKIADEKIPAAPWQISRKVEMWPGKTPEFMIRDVGQLHSTDELTFQVERHFLMKADGEVSTGHTSVAVEWRPSINECDDRIIDVSAEHLNSLIAALASAAAEINAQPRRVRRRAEVDEHLREREV